MGKKLLLLWFVLNFILIHGPNVDALTRTREEYEKAGEAVWERNTTEKLVAITFDDGPHGVFTPKILDLLAKYDAKATFFVTGKNALLYPEIIKRQDAEGHEIGNHTFHHISSKHMNSSQLSMELDKTNEAIEKIIGKKPTLYRPVEGVYNDIIIHTARKKGFEVIMWSWDQDALDWLNPQSSKIVQHVKKGLSPGDIIILHDWNNSSISSTVKAMEPILELLTENGYKCVTVSELLYRTNRPLPPMLDPIPALPLNQ